MVLQIIYALSGIAKGGGTIKSMERSNKEWMNKKDGNLQIQNGHHGPPI